MKKTYTAPFVGGDPDGTAVELNEPHPVLFSTLEAAGDGEIVLAERFRSVYTLVSNGPPMRYELSKPAPTSD
jgi:hypothetical protein